GGRPDTALLADFQKLIRLRNQHDVLRRGSIEAPIHLDEDIIVLTRRYEGVRAITAFNNSTAPQSITVELPPGYGDMAYRDALSRRAIKSVSSRLTLTVPALFGTVLIAE
ncbi:MAG: hypothetical protein J2P17_22255, partial [Mycobacterium sp.]|nr:hypothetical protein [Mycobacterium sp.]